MIPSTPGVSSSKCSSRPRSCARRTADRFWTSKTPASLTDPKAAFTQNPAKKIELDLVHDAVGAMYGGSKDKKESDRPAEEQFGKAHYEQHMAVSGTLRVDGETIEAVGPRSPRSLMGPSLLAGDRVLRVADHELRSRSGIDGPRSSGATPDNIRRGGVMIRGDQLEPLTWCDVTAEYEEGTPLPPHGARRREDAERRGAPHRRQGHGNSSHCATGAAA